MHPLCKLFFGLPIHTVIPSKDQHLSHAFNMHRPVPGTMVSAETTQMNRTAYDLSQITGQFIRAA